MVYGWEVNGKKVSGGVILVSTDYPEIVVWTWHDRVYSPNLGFHGHITHLARFLAT
jgi:hypothetical protein